MRGLKRQLKPLIRPTISSLSWLARVTAPWMVALSAGVSPPAVRMPIRFMSGEPLERGQGIRLTFQSACDILTNTCEPVSVGKRMPLDPRIEDALNCPSLFEELHSLIS